MTRPVKRSTARRPSTRSRRPAAMSTRKRRPASTAPSTAQADGTADAPAPKAHALVRTLPKGKTPIRDVAELVAEGIGSNAVATLEWSSKVLGTEIDLTELSTVMHLTAADVRAGDLGALEGQLAAQATTLNALFLNALHRAARTSSPELFEMFMRIGLRAQNQCRATAETLGALKMPPVFARQANIANGPQQVNNGTPGAPARLPQLDSRTHKLLEAPSIDGERVDAGTTTPATSRDSAVETVDAQHRPAHGSGKGAGGPQRIQGASGQSTRTSARVRPDDAGASQ